MAADSTAALAEKFHRDHGPAADAANMRARIAARHGGNPFPESIRTYVFPGGPKYLVDVTADDRSTP